MYQVQDHYVQIYLIQIMLTPVKVIQVTTNLKPVKPPPQTQTFMGWSIKYQNSCTKFTPYKDLKCSQSPSFSENDDGDDEVGKSFSPKGVFRTVDYILEKHKQVCKFKCKPCNLIFNCPKEYSYYYKDQHNQLQYFKWQDHGKLKLVCDRCGQVFVFKSILKVHKRIHKSLATFCYKACKETPGN